MRKIGLIAGMSWESSAIYYKHINKMVGASLGGVHSAEIIMYSVDYDPYISLGAKGNWEEVGRRVTEIARKLERAGAECILVCCNTVHMIADVVETSVNVPFLHIVDPCGEAILEKGLQKVGLIGTNATMEREFFKGRLLEKFCIETVVPSVEDRAYIDQAIKKEFCRGHFYPETKKRFLTIIEKLEAAGAEGVILGCTEIPILLSENDFSIPGFDTTFLHSKAAVSFALETNLQLINHAS
ncbi:aspartate/glutamate racemase family protein [Desertivirga brevis]|uniref:aspartate/glutamate racemase family protein n=1 Tax=Desertivirga brevis TaxID=2810310 RepID=UPI001A96112D|nr:aspartate/glutamate racemase family protein [Pedobacter sp. SYSU D00873]